ncbi:MAG: calcium/sodium antiporter [Hymenobacteraceae bacterium]|nr:calcium/sodium antiporter [Hymenobacteraceae bacterium]MDX5394959.1 calcium/sodium antiporter [Hymenobacteraceae bacterium]MDX5444000.1 calcium/sodium antiporter [Hymenobacteraceae bacterium]MDX5510993.1 calcium/sodium antiporter [Hymenobacteraceae bacterium]
MLSAALLILGLVIIALGSNWLVEGAASVARSLQVSDLVIGLTIVSFGTSAPELAVNLFASFGGNTEIAIGNVLGSNIFNIAVILGISAVIHPIYVTSNTVWIEIPLTLLAAIMIGVCANDVLLDNVAVSQITRSDGLALLGFFMVFMYYSYFVAKKNKADSKPDETPKYPLFKSFFLIGIGLGGLIAGGKLMVDSAVSIAKLLGLSENIIGITIVATGTSLPELATSVAAALKKSPDIALGNVVGSNIFNVFLILGLSSVLRPLPFNETANFDIGMTVFVSVLLLIFAFVGRSRTISRLEGAILFAFYVLYIWYLLSHGS